jgi:hypothetical protein
MKFPTSAPMSGRLRRFDMIGRIYKRQRMLHVLDRTHLVPVRPKARVA